MLNNFIGGGQVFLHKLRMFGQVFFRTFYVSWLMGVVISIAVHWTDLQKLDWDAFLSYKKAYIATEFNYFLNDIRESMGKSPNHVIYINAKTNKSFSQNIDAKKVLKMNVFKHSDRTAGNLFWDMATTGFLIFLGGFGLIYILWSRFGSELKSETTKEGSDAVLSAKEVSKKLRKLNRASGITIGNMPLVKNSETKHFLISGASGCGKTNLFHNILPQVEQNKQPAIVIDQTGEMLAKYYNPSRGDIIFNPFDERSKSWNFWKDCETEEDLERFSKILFGFNRKSVGHNNDPFWEQSAEVVFNACAMQLKSEKNFSIETLTAMVSQTSRKTLAIKLQGTKAARYLEDEGRSTASSILSVLATCTKPLSYLTDCDVEDQSNLIDSRLAYSNTTTTSFSLKEYFENIQNGSKAWIFLGTKPSARALTLPLIACLTELALARLMDTQENPKRRVWFVIDELAALNKLPAISILTAEGRKYGACILAGIQSLNQIYEHYGRYAGSSIFGQFGTNFFFRNVEPEVGKMLSSISGKKTITRHQKNTSFGANEFRDGVSYNEQENNKPLLEYSDLANLAVGECYVLLPEPKVRLAKIEVPQANLQEKNKSFIQAKERPKKNIVMTSPSEEAIGSYESNKDNNDNYSDTSSDKFEEWQGSSHGGNSMSAAIESEKVTTRYKKQRKKRVVVKSDYKNPPKIDGFEYFS